ncbi:MAG: orotidine-5'-phosphate decarboxylase [Rubrivivax sp.]|nr:orotidine-5'-phosphate decarboxylase [Rubrivivax sp.]
MTRPSFTDQLALAEGRAKSLLCVGLDPEPGRFPQPWRGDARRIGDFCAAVVDATHDLALAFKPQIAHFAAHRAEEQLERLIAHIRAVAPEVPVILDAKRGDIGSTAEHYAREAFERYGADAVTLSPFMGADSLEPYMRHAGRGLIVLCRTSNPGGSDLQAQRLESGELIYERIARLAATEWNRGGQLGLVVGATFPRELARVRELAPRLPLLVPGVGAQGGDAQTTVRLAWRPDAPVMVSSSRAILYAGGDHASVAAAAGAARAAAQATRAALEQGRAAA